MTNSWKIGGVTLELREDGNFFIYQPDSSRVLSRDLAIEVAQRIYIALGGETPPLASDFDPEFEKNWVAEWSADAERGRSTVGGGVIGTSEGPVNPGLTDTEKVASSDSSDAQRSDGLTATELEADRNASEARVLLDEMAAAAEADGSADTVTEFGPPRTEIVTSEGATPSASPSVPSEAKPEDLVIPTPARRRPGRPRKTT